jgi:HAD superfamily hydrolase (TIGR01509 family)
MVISGEVKLIKPDRAIFELLLERIARPAADCLLIDDNEENLSVAQSLGIQTIHFHSAEQLKIELQARGILLGNHS